MRFTLRQLEYFIAAGETGSITLASEQIHISQPSISTAISHLEQEIGVQLFVRHHALGLSLTHAGKSLLREAKRVIDQAQGLYAVASEATDQIRGDLVVGCLTTLAPMVMPELMHSFTAAYPETRIRHIGTNQERLLDGLRRAEIDAAITYNLQIDQDISFIPLARLPMHVVMGEKHEFACREALSLHDLVNEPMLLLDLPLSREYFLAMFTKEGLQPNIRARSEHPDVIRSMVANGYGYTLANVLPRSDFALDGRRVVRIRLSGDHPPMVVGVATLGQLAQSRLVSAFQNHCGALISDAYIPGMVAPDVEARVGASGKDALKSGGKEGTGGQGELVRRRSIAKD
jgi:DNA-binding transcriptional LysR family regulator